MFCFLWTCLPPYMFVYLRRHVYAYFVQDTSQESVLWCIDMFYLLLTPPSLHVHMYHRISLASFSMPMWTSEDKCVHTVYNTLHKKMLSLMDRDVLCFVNSLSSSSCTCIPQKTYVYMLCARYLTSKCCLLLLRCFVSHGFSWSPSLYVYLEDICVHSVYRITHK